jgi:hypothetical protein
MAVACFASIAILAGSMVAVYGLEWYKNRKRRNMRLTKKLVAGEDYTTREQQPIAEQLA